MLRVIRRFALVPVLVVAAVACGDDDGGSGDDAPPIRYHHIQVVGSHNSYHLEPEPALFGAIRDASTELAESIEYSHLPIAQQLADHHVRQLEIDVFADPEGGRFAAPTVPPLLGLDVDLPPELDRPGFKVFHTQDFDFRTTCLTLVACLEVVRDWSDANPDHLPVMIMVEAKDLPLLEAAAEEGIEIPEGLEFTEPLPLTAALYDDLEAEILSVFQPDRVLTPDEVRGDHDTLEQAVLAEGWPEIDDLRGTVAFSLVNLGEAADVYRNGSPALEGKLLFTSATPGEPDAAFVRVDDPVEDGDEIRELVGQGYLVRTRADVPTADARSGDTRRRDAAFESGAHFVSTDYYVPDPDFETGYVVELPGGGVARCNPVSAPESCSAEALRE